MNGSDDCVSVNEHLDLEWVELVIAAKNLGMTIEQIRSTLGRMIRESGYVKGS